MVPIPRWMMIIIVVPRVSSNYLVHDLRWVIFRSTISWCTIRGAQLSGGKLVDAPSKMLNCLKEN